MKRRWIAFDLDGTLHDFSKAAAAALLSVLPRLSAITRQSPLKLQTLYRLLAEQDVDKGFILPQESHDYRRLRFTRLLRSVGVSQPTIKQNLPFLLNKFERASQKALRCPSETRILLAKLTAEEFDIAVITEGPRDAQERALNRLGITCYVSALFSSSEYGVSKLTGLFDRISRDLGLVRYQNLFVGDSFHRDIIPSFEAGFVPVWLSKSDNSCDLLRARISRGYCVPAIRNVAAVVDHFSRRLSQQSAANEVITISDLAPDRRG